MDHKGSDEDRSAEDRVLAAVDAERCRLARELHDGLGQALTGVLLLSSAEQDGVERSAGHLSALLAEAKERTRGLSRTLDPSAQASSLARLLGDLADQLSERFQRPFAVAASPPEVTLSGAQRQHLHHLIVDAVRYAMLHKGVTSITLSATQDAQLAVHMLASIAEGRVGLPPGEEAQGQACLALLRDRLRSLHGELDTAVEPTRVSVRLRWPHTPAATP
ncbi:MAG: histidine kinase [Pseudomonadota bacterium]